MTHKNEGIEMTKANKSKSPKETLRDQYAEGKAQSVAAIGTHAYYEARRRERHPERYQHLLIVMGSSKPDRVKGRSKRGWTSPTK